MNSQGMPTAYLPLVLLLSNLPALLAQAVSILPSTPSSTFPACALICPNLNAASGFCTQTNAGQSEQTINSCFCQRAEVVPLYQGSTGVCDASCSNLEDLLTIQSWFQNYCSAAGVGDGTVTTLITSTRPPTNTATGSSSNGSGRGSQSSSSSSQSSGWFASHWKWIVMVVVLFVGLGALALLAVCLKRRHARKREERRVASSGILPPRGGNSPDVGHGREMWGPHQHMAHTGGWEYTIEQDRAMREASMAGGAGVLGSAVGKTKSLKGQGSKRLGKKSRHDSQRSTTRGRVDPDRIRGEPDENTRSAIASIRRSKSEKRRQREAERDRDKEVESSLRAPQKESYDESARKEKQRIDMGDP